MSSYVKIAAEVSDKYVAALAQSQKTFLNYLDSTRNWATSAPTAAAPDLKLPTAQEVLTANIALASKSISRQKEFTRKLFAMLTPDAKPAPAAKPAAKAAPAPAAKEATAKTVAAAKPAPAAAAKPATAKTTRKKK